MDKLAIVIIARVKCTGDVTIKRLESHILVVTEFLSCGQIKYYLELCEMQNTKERDIVSKFENHGTEPIVFGVIQAVKSCSSFNCQN